MSDYNEQLRELIKTGEGSIDHMYLDTVGKVTVGVGNMLPNIGAAQQLPFVQRGTDADATPAQVAQEFEKMAAQQPGQIASSYRQYTHLYLPEEAINDLLDGRITGFERGLVSDFPGYEQFPAPARMALMDMAFNLGNKGLVTKFPSLTRAARMQDWQTCAQECQRRGIADIRNKETRDLFLAAAG